MSVVHEPVRNHAVAVEMLKLYNVVVATVVDKIR